MKNVIFFLLDSIAVATVLQAFLFFAFITRLLNFDLVEYIVLPGIILGYSIYLVWLGAFIYLVYRFWKAPVSSREGNRILKILVTAAAITMFNAFLGQGMVSFMASF